MKRGYSADLNTKEGAEQPIKTKEKNPNQAELLTFTEIDYKKILITINQMVIFENYLMGV